ncbi:transposase [Pseudoxanthomonas sp. z9]|uniref:transposase n=1 Tax=Pseudoxanthomonas sp. z9 TaxID=2584942 RepID=UPI001142C45A|nr:transposase [Pseudoxanthomonas sp. z9]
MNDEHDGVQEGGSRAVMNRHEDIFPAGSGVPEPTGLDEASWARISERLSRRSLGRVHRNNSTRVFVEVVLWVAETGGAWDRIPRRYGNRHSIYVRFTRWAQDGTWIRILLALDEDGIARENLKRLVGNYLRLRKARQDILAPGEAAGRTPSPGSG